MPICGAAPSIDEGEPCPGENVNVPTDEELTLLSKQLGVSRRDLEAFVEAWNRSGRHQSLVDFLGVIPEQRTSQDELATDEGSRTA
jgi:hypothetical protein